MNEGKEKVLSQEEVLKLYNEIKDGNPNARQTLIESNIRMAIFIANKYRNIGIEIHDLINTGVIGLIKGVDTYDTNKGTPLSSYLWKCIENEILMLIRKDLKRFTKEISINLPVYKCENNKFTILDTISSGQEADDPFQKYFKKERYNIIIEMIADLPPKEQAVILMRYGFMDDKEMTQREISEHLGVVRTTVTRKEAKILRNMRKKIPTSEFKNLL